MDANINSLATSKKQEKPFRNCTVQCDVMQCNAMQCDVMQYYQAFMILPEIKCQMKNNVNRPDENTEDYVAYNSQRMK